jgi:hypothetical protein
MEAVLTCQGFHWGDRDSQSMKALPASEFFAPRKITH